MRVAMPARDELGVLGDDAHKREPELHADIAGYEMATGTEIYAGSAAQCWIADGSESHTGLVKFLLPFTILQFVQAVCRSKCDNSED